MRNLTQEDMARMLNTTKQVISRYETNQRTPKITVAVEYSKRLNIPLDYLIDDSIDQIEYTIINRTEDNKFEKKHTSFKFDADPYKSQLDDCYNMLNNYGKREACRRISELTEIPRYTVNSKEKEVQQTNSITFMDEENEQELSDEERQKQLAQFLKDRREGKIRFTSYAAYGGNSVEGKATTKEDSDALSDAVKKIKAARQHKNTGEDES